MQKRKLYSELNAKAKARMLNQHTEFLKGKTYKADCGHPGSKIWWVSVFSANGSLVGYS